MNWENTNSSTGVVDESGNNADPVTRTGSCGRFKYLIERPSI